MQPSGLVSPLRKCADSTKPAARIGAASRLNHECEEVYMDKVVHFEIPFDDKQRAMKFYASAFGWQLTDMPDMNYVMATSVEVDDRHMPKVPGAINGGMLARPKEAPHPTIYLDVPSVDAAIKSVQTAGGKVVTPRTPIPGMGAYARVADTEGNIIGLYESQH
jgi:predicted enzyme related to lactoylglutathione lyase